MAYLFYLAVRQWRTAAVDLREQVGTAMDGGGLALVVRGFLVNATNPKGLVFFLAVLPQFVVPTAPLLPQYLAIGVTMVAVDLVVMGLYTGPVGAPAQVDAHSAQADGAQPRVLGPIRRGRRRAVAGPRARPADRYRVKTVLPGHRRPRRRRVLPRTTRSTAGVRSQGAVINSRISGITARAFTRPVTNRKPRVYIDSRGISTPPW